MSQQVNTDTQVSSEDPGVDAIPGTVRLIYQNPLRRREHAKGDSDIVLIPATPSQVEYPLQWTHRRKLLSTSCTCLYTLALGLSSAVIYSVLVPMSEATGLSVSVLNQGTEYQFLLYGWGCLIWQPVAMQYGKRPVYLLSTVASIAILIWQPFTRTPGQYFASKILQGLFGAPIESLCEISIADLWHQHERGKYLALYSFLLAGSGYLAHFLMAFINKGQGWRWCFYWSAIFLALTLLFNLWFMEETNWNTRYTVTATETSVYSSVCSLEDLHRPMNDTRRVFSASLESDATRPLGMVELQQRMKTSTSDQRRRSFQIWKLPLRPFSYLSLPAVVWSGFSYGLTLVWVYMMNATSSIILTTAPYRFSSSAVGLTYLAPFLGSAVSALYSGNLGDCFSLRMARRNGGVSEAEHRLWLFGVSCLVTPLALLLWGVGAAYHVHWFVLMIALFAMGLQLSLSISVSIIYTLDSYRDIGAEAIVAVILIRSTMSFATNFAITPWIARMGLQNAFIVAAAVSFISFATFLPMILLGKKLRRHSAHSYQRFVEQGKRLGLIS